LFNSEPPDPENLMMVTRRNLLTETEDKFQELVNGGVLIRWDDTGAELVRRELQDVDFDDFIVGVGGKIDDCIPLEQIEQLYPQQEPNPETESNKQ
jgi:hypothetical protein